MTTEYTTLTDLDAILKRVDADDVLHAAETNQIPLMSINVWTDLGLVNESGRPTELCRNVAAAIKARRQ